MQNSEEIRKKTRLAESFFFQKKEILVFQPKRAVFDFCAADVFYTLGLVKNTEDYAKIYNKLSVKYISPNCFFENEKGDLQEIKMLNLEGVKHLAGRVGTPVGKEFVAWAEQDLPLLALQTNTQNESQSIDFQTFVFEERDNIRILLDTHGEPWFVVLDLCKALGHTKPSKAVEDHCEADGVTKSTLVDSIGKRQEMLLVNEFNLYALILGSTKPNAKRFKNWVFGEVLPTLRKTGKYEILPKKETNTFDALVGKVQELIDAQMAEMKEEIQTIKSQIEAYLPARYDTTPSYVYLAYNHTTGLFKIGKSDDPNVRIKVIGIVGNHIEIICKICFPSANMALLWERTLQESFIAQSAGREWFALQNNQVDFIKNLATIVEVLYA